MEGRQYFTKEGLDRIVKELQELKTTGREKMAEAISEARDKGDLRENAEYDAAKEAQGLHEARIAELESLVANSRIIDESQLDLSKVSILSSVKLKNLSNNMEVKYTLVSAKEANFAKGKISVDSPVGSGLLGKKIGESVEIKVPAGLMKFEVLDIFLDND